MEYFEKRQKKKYTKFLDTDLITEPLDVNMFRQKNGRPCLVLCDDVLDVLDSRSNTVQSQVRNWLITLFQGILVKGRVENITLWIIFHRARMGKVTNAIYQESSALLTFPRNNTHALQDLLTKKLAISKKIVNRIINKNNGRWLLWKFTAPMCVIGEQLVCLI